MVSKMLPGFEVQVLFEDGSEWLRWHEWAVGVGEEEVPGNFPVPLRPSLLLVDYRSLGHEQLQTPS